MVQVVVLYSGPVGSGLAFGQVEDKILAVDGVDVPYSVSTFIFDSITIGSATVVQVKGNSGVCLLYTSPSPRDAHESRMPSSA